MLGWGLSRKRLLLIIVIFTLGSCVLIYRNHQMMIEDAKLSRLIGLSQLQKLSFDNDDGPCNFPELPVNSSLLSHYMKTVGPVQCTKGGRDWVKCNAFHDMSPEYITELCRRQLLNQRQTTLRSSQDTTTKLEGHKCQVKGSVLAQMQKVVCKYRDILWASDLHTKLGQEIITKINNEVYLLKESDFVEVRCTGVNLFGKSESWSGYSVGIRDSKSIKRRLSWEKLNGEAMRYNVLMFGFDSLSKNTFIRKLPKSYRVLKEELGAQVLEGYNIVGDGTPQALIPILTGSTELELPDVRKRMGDKAESVSIYPFVWKEFAQNGYVTAFHEDTPNVGIFTYRLSGFSSQPVDHYMRTYFLHTDDESSKWTQYCNGDTPKHKIMMDYIKQFMETYADYPRFVFGFHGELSHNDYNLVQAADDDLSVWLRDLKSSGILENTILITMSDHGHRFGAIRNTLQGKQEERLPWFSFVLPPDMTAVRPQALNNIRDNVNRLTSPFDIHATLLDVLGMNPNQKYDVKSKYPPRSLSVFGPIPVHRTCGQAGIEPHWCTCLTWKPVSLSQPIVQRVAKELVAALNKVTLSHRDRCALLTLDKLEWAMSLTATKGIQKFKESSDMDGFVPAFTRKTAGIVNIYQIKVRVMPGASLFEASLMHNLDDDSITVKMSDVSRINKYGDQARCVYESLPHLRKYCYCTTD